MRQKTYFETALLQTAEVLRKLLKGRLPPAKLRLLLAWMEIHKDELLADWELAVRGQQPYKIEPLR